MEIYHNFKRDYQNNFVFQPQTSMMPLGKENCVQASRGKYRKWDPKAMKKALAASTGMAECLAATSVTAYHLIIMQLDFNI